MTSVRAAEGIEAKMKCPNCGARQLDIYVNQAILAFNGDLFEISLETVMWDDLSDCECFECKHMAQVIDFKPKVTQSEDPP